MNISVCIDAIYEGLDPVIAMEQVKALGLDTIEFWTWWDKDLGAIKRAKDNLDMNISTICTKFISLVDEKKHNEYITGLKETIEACKYLGVTHIISQVGDELSQPRSLQHKALVEGLKKCVSILEENNITLMIEPLNTKIDHGGYYLTTSSEAFEIINEVNSPNVKVIFDMYHQYITEGNLLHNISENIGSIAHFHAAGYPGRHELDEGEINYPFLFETIDTLNFEGYIGFEYFPKEDQEEGLLRFLE